MGTSGGGGMYARAVNYKLTLSKNVHCAIEAGRMISFCSSLLCLQPINERGGHGGARSDGGDQSHWTSMHHSRLHRPPPPAAADPARPLTPRQKSSTDTKDPTDESDIDLGCSIGGGIGYFFILCVFFCLLGCRGIGVGLAGGGGMDEMGPRFGALIEKCIYLKTTLGAVGGGLVMYGDLSTDNLSKQKSNKPGAPS